MAGRPTAMLETNNRRPVIDPLDEVRSKQKEFEDIQMDALFGRREWRLVQIIEYLEISEQEWNSLYRMIAIAPPVFVYTIKCKL